MYAVRSAALAFFSPVRLPTFTVNGHFSQPSLVLTGVPRRDTNISDNYGPPFTMHSKIAEEK